MKKIFFFLILSAIVLAQDKNKFPVDTSFTIYSAYQKEVKNSPFIRIAIPNISDKITVRENLVYKSLGERELHIDLFLPAETGDKLLPAVILIHGGGWRSGNKTMEHPMAAELASHGYLTATVEYRLSPEAKYPAGVFDIKDAVKWLKKNSNVYNIDTNRIAALGTSAGGTLAALLGATGGIAEFEETGVQGYTSTVHAIVDIDGILDFTHPAESAKDTIPGKLSAGAAWFGALYKDNPELWRSASPMEYADKKTPPVIFINSAEERFHAGRDEFIDKIKPYNTYYEVHMIPGTKHGFWLFHPWFEETAKFTINFLDKVLKEKNEK